MIGDVSKAERLCIACGYTDMRKSIDGLSALARKRFSDSFSNSFFLFCRRRCDRLKALYLFRYRNKYRI